MSSSRSSRLGKKRLPWQQYTILALVRLSEPIANTSVYPYLPAMVSSFSNVKPADIGYWTGITVASFSLAQASTAILWGRLSDKVGRKPAILVGLLNTMIMSLIWGCSKNLGLALFVRVLSGASNGNVGIIRTMELQPLAFSVMPIVFAVGSVIGPAIGGALANPLHRPPSDRTSGPLLWTFPYALPNIISASFFLAGIIIGSLFLRETLESKKDRQDYGIILGQKMVSVCESIWTILKRWVSRRPRYMAIPNSSDSAASVFPKDIENQAKVDQSTKVSSSPPCSKVLTKQTVLYLVAYTLLAMHAAGFDQIVSVILHHPRNNGTSHRTKTSLPFRFNRGFGLSTAAIGHLFTLNGFLSIFAQFVIYPPVARKLGMLKTLHCTLILMPFCYWAIPYAALIENQTLAEVAFFAIWILKSSCSIMAFPCTTILITRSASSLAVLATINGIATSVAAIGRAAGPFIIGTMFTWGTKNNFLLAPFAILAVLTLIGWIPLFFTVEADGFGDDDDFVDNDDDDNENDDDDDDGDVNRFGSESRLLPSEKYASTKT